MAIDIKHTGGESMDVPVRRRNPQGASYDNLTVSLPKELTAKITKDMEANRQSRSLVVTELITEAYKARERK